MKTKYFVNEEKRTVACVLEFNLYTDEIRHSTITGIAKCSEADEFDETKGKIIANTRAHIEYHNEVIAIRKIKLERFKRRVAEEELKVAHNEAARKGLKAKLAKVVSE